ncbi:hypothetical protein HNQ88_004014 [Aureibacter tunicatorum]|uniref:Uncharacterized protein n=1 Tax=Aureibacter tunicatorum TaxID=866807 RepID=A0AAE3XRV7_9BACT|nr:hypothetical protein [Aureibacter tunicatorum]BDD03718.1 hypothetical protein AUTU_12010 [Aureibacter tunicatorum]
MVINLYFNDKVFNAFTFSVLPSNCSTNRDHLRQKVQKITVSLIFECQEKRAMWILWFMVMI